MARKTTTPPSPAAEFLLIGAAEAAEMLEANTKNRRVSEQVVSAYRADMKAGLWETTGAPIQFSVTGRLLDGQHRLLALAGLPDVKLHMLVVRDLPDAAQLQMDRGRIRSSGNQLELLGIEYGKFIASVAKWHLVITSGLLFKDRTLQSEVTTNARIVEWALADEERVSFLQGIANLTGKVDAPPSVVGTAVLLFADAAGRRSALEFFGRLRTDGHPSGDPVNTLQVRFARLRRAEMFMPDRDKLALLITAWNAWHDGRSLVKFQRPQGGTYTAETFPVPQGRRRRA